MPSLQDSKLFLHMAQAFRFFIEFLKLPQGIYDTTTLNMGQLLSVPFVILGVYLVLPSREKTI